MKANSHDVELATARMAYLETRKAITYGNDFKLSALGYLEFQERTGKLYRQITLPSIVQRLLALLNGTIY